VDSTTGTILLKATFPNTSSGLWVGQFVKTFLRLFVEQNALVIPAECVVSGQRGTYVYVIDSTNTARQRLVTIEREAEGLKVISSGLEDGERVVVDGQSRLVPGAPVTVRDPSGGPVPDSLAGPAARGQKAPGAGNGRGGDARGKGAPPRQ